MPRSLPRRSLLAPLALAISLAACSGSSAASPSPTNYANPSTSASPAASTNGASASPAASTGAIPSFDLSGLSTSIPGLDSYQTSITEGGKAQYKTVVVAKPVLSKAITTYASDGTTIDSRIIVVGPNAWSADGPSGAFTAIPSGGSSALLAAFDPSLILSAYTSLDWASMASNKGVESKNGIQATHLAINSTGGLGLAAAIPAGASIDVWVAQAGYIVAWEMTGFGTDNPDLMIEVTNVNDPANVVTAPS